MFNIRPLPVMLWSLLLIAIGGGLFYQGVKINRTKRVTYVQYLERMADMSRHESPGAKPPQLEVWDMGYTFKLAGSVVATPGLVLLLASAVTMVLYKRWPGLWPGTKESQREREAVEGAEDEPIQHTPQDQRIDLDEEEADTEDELGPEIPIPPAEPEGG